MKPSKDSKTARRILTRIVLLALILQVPFFIDDQETPSTPKADALFIPRENPRALVIHPMEQWSGRANGETRYPSKDATHAHETGNLSLI